MNENQKAIAQRKILRKKAEGLVETFAPAKSAIQTAEILMHELMVHKVELEMQNEELQRTNNLMEESRDRYVELYEFSPVGHISLSREGLVREINLTGSVMLGVERFRIISRRFSSYIAPHEKNRWHRLFMNIMEHSESEKHAVDLEMVRANGSTLYAYLNCIKSKTSASKELRITLTDISQLKQAAH